MKNIFQNTRKPEGFGGRIMVNMMNSGHAALAKWGFTHISPSTDDAVLDVGCGGGANIAVLLSLYQDGTVTGIDYSSVSVEKARKVNKSAVRAGICKVLQGDVSALPFEDGSFDLTTAFETIYFWPNIGNAFLQVLRVLKPGGIFMICNEADGMKRADEKWANIIESMTVYDKEQTVKLLESVGFAKIKAYGEPKKCTAPELTDMKQKSLS